MDRIPVSSFSAGLKRTQGCGPFVFFLLSAGQVEHLPDLLVELAGGEEFLKGQVHAVAPVVVAVGGNVDAFRCGILVTELGTHGEPVLQGEYGQDGG